MYAAFVKLLNMSAAAGILIAVVIALRFLLRKTPKKYICILWAIVALRLICPISISSAVSAFNYIGHTPQSSGQVEYIHYNGKSEKPKAEVTITIPAESEKNDGPTVNFTTKDFYIPTFFGIWAAGFASMVLYAAYSYTKVRVKVQMSIPLGRRNYLRNIYLCDEIPSPFILGVVKPKIYLPSALDVQQQDSVIAHERAHLARRDHWWKPLGFLLLSVHWFNPMVWIAYAMLCRDIEMACDEKVIERMTPAQKQTYSSVLLTCSMPRKAITACPLAFGEAGVKERVRGILNYRKPSFWVISISIILCIAIAVCFLSNPLRTEDYIRFRRADTKPHQEHTYQFKMQMGKTVKGPIVFAEQWCSGELVQSEHCTIPEGEKDLAVSVTETKDGSEYQVEIDTNPYTAALNASFSLPAGTRLMDVYSWHGAKDIPLVPNKQVLLAAYIFGNDGFMIFDFDNEDFAEAGDRLRNQECAILVYAEFDAVHPINALHAGYWDSLRQNGLLRQENGEEIFYLTLPAKYAGELPQEEYDAGNGFWYQSARKQEDGSVVYGLNLTQYNEDLYMLEEMMESVCRYLSNVLSGEIAAVVHNPEFTEFTVTVASESVDSLDYERVYQSVNFDARLYSLYVTGDIRREITIRYQDTHGNPVEPMQPNYWLTVGADGVSSIDVDFGNAVYSYCEPSLAYYFVGESRKLSRLDGMGSLEDVSIIAKNDADQVIWQHRFTGDEEFPWEENGWRLSQNASPDHEQKQLGSALSILHNQELGNLLEFVNPVRVEYQDNTLIDKVSAGEQMTLEELLLSDHWTEQPIPEGVVGPGPIRRGMILRAENGDFMVISYDTDALCIYNVNGKCIGRYTGSYTGEQMVDMLWDWMAGRLHTGSAYFAGATLTQTAPNWMFSILMHPTTALNIDGMGAVTPENQEEWIAAWNTVLNSGKTSSDEANAESYYGVILQYDDTYLKVHKDKEGFSLREMGGSWFCYSAEDSKPLINLLEPILKDFSYSPVKPSDLKGIQYANLVLDGMRYAIPQGDPKLSQLESILTAGTPIGYMPGCWFTSLLIVGLPSGETKTISVATDSCGAYLANGVCYELPGDNAQLFQLFGVDLNEQTND